MRMSAMLVIWQKTFKQNFIWTPWHWYIYAFVVNWVSKPNMIYQYSIIPKNWLCNKFHYKCIWKSIWLLPKKIKSQLRITMLIELIGLVTWMLKTKYKGSLCFGSGELDVQRVLILLKHGGHLVSILKPSAQTFVSLISEGQLWNVVTVCRGAWDMWYTFDLGATEKKSF